MATVLVDFENVNAKDGLRGVQYLTEKDTLHIFYSESCRSIRTDYCETIMESQCQFGISKLKNTGKNALDFYIACEAGIAAVNERYVQKKELREKIYSVFYNDEQDAKYASIIDFASVDKKRSRKELYTGCLHQFGRSEGLDIYHKLKDII